MPASIPTTVSVVSPKTIGQWQQTAAEDAAVSRRRAAVEGPDFPTPGRGVNTEIGQARSTEVLAGAAWDQFDTQAGQVRRPVYIPDSTSDRNFGEAQHGINVQGTHPDANCQKAHRSVCNSRTPPTHERHSLV
jgi:hypothetical protein